MSRVTVLSSPVPMGSPWHLIRTIEAMLPSALLCLASRTTWLFLSRLARPALRLTLASPVLLHLRSSGMLPCWSICLPAPPNDYPVTQRSHHAVSISKCVPLRPIVVVTHAPQPRFWNPRSTSIGHVISHETHRAVGRPSSNVEPTLHGQGAGMEKEMLPSRCQGGQPPESLRI